MDYVLSIKQEEDHLLLAIQRKERWAMRKLYEDNYSLLYPVCMRYAQNEEDAQDIIHDGFIKIFKNISKYQSGSSLISWMKRIMVNSSIDHYREKKRKQTEEITPIIHLRTDKVDVISSMSEKEIIDALRLLSPTYRTVFNMFVVEGYSHREIADSLNITESTSRSNLVKARNKLKEILLSKDGFYEE
ncbi:MAG TPA: sigma-70 family RNA polymerase sigma factor [Saprospiraceae bacterium]|nr:sigma-70 family RNA polymerase sigma factor [Saprospiraceae bacterium]